MVLYFTSLADPSYTIFAGKNKDENEVLLRWNVVFPETAFFLTAARYCWPEDVWFHVDDYSSVSVAGFKRGCCATYTRSRTCICVSSRGSRSTRFPSWY